jgi:hypothetical protein
VNYLSSPLPPLIYILSVIREEGLIYLIKESFIYKKANFKLRGGGGKERSL